MDMRGFWLFSVVLLLGLGLTTSAPADEPVAEEVSVPTAEEEAVAATEEEPAPAPPKEPPPLPLHGIEGMGGIFATYSAYLVNPAGPGEIFGMPSAGFAYVFLGHGRHLLAPTVTATLWDRLELGYGFNYFDLGDLPLDLLDDPRVGVRISDDSVNLHNFNARLLMLKEGAFGQSWLPALTAGIHYKWNTDIDNINDDLNGGLRGIGIADNDGLDFTLYASKLLTFLPRPLLINVGMRTTQAAHLGLLGFTDDWEFLFEGNGVLFLTDRFAIGGEYRQKSSDYTPIPGLVEPEDDWWTVVAAFVVNEHLTFSGGYGNFGWVLNHRANGSWGIKAKWEF
jgi:hypothetical protein